MSHWIDVKKSPPVGVCSRLVVTGDTVTYVAWWDGTAFRERYTGLLITDVTHHAEMPSLDKPDLNRELVTKDARIAELESQLAKLKPKAFEWKGAGLYRMRCGGVISVDDDVAHRCGQFWIDFYKQSGHYFDTTESPLDLVEFIAPLA